MSGLIESLIELSAYFLIFFLPSSLLVLLFKFSDIRYYSKLYSIKKRRLIISYILTVPIIFVIVNVIEAVFLICRLDTLLLIVFFVVPPVISIIELLLLKKYDRKVLDLCDEGKNIIISFTRVSIYIYAVFVFIVFLGCAYYISNYVEIHILSESMSKRETVAALVYGIAFTVLYIFSIIIKILSNKKIVKRFMDRKE